MKQTFSSIIKNEPQRTVTFFAMLFSIRAVVQILLYQQGFISASADEFARGIRAAQWAANPSINLLTDLQDTWLPFEKYLNGLFLLIWPDPIWAPRFTVFVASCLLLIIIFRLSHYLFGRFETAVLTSLLIAIHPWYIWLSGTPMLEMYYFVFFFAGLLFIIKWVRDDQPRGWLWAGLCFAFASGLHVQSWTLINLINLLTVPLLFRLTQQKAWSPLSKLIAYYFISNSLIILFALTEFLYTGQLFAFLGSHTAYSMQYYSGYLVPNFNKFLYYPQIVLLNANSVLWIMLTLGLAFLFFDKDRAWKFFPLLLTLNALLLNSILNILSGPPSAAPGRYSLLHIIILSLYAGYGLYRLATFRPANMPKQARYVLPLLTAVLFLYTFQLNARRIPNYPEGMPLDAVQTGQQLNQLLRENPENYLIELYFWEFLAVNLASQHFESVNFDRELNYFAPETPSIFQQGPPDLCQSLAASNITFLALKNESYRQAIIDLDIVKEQKMVGSWAIFEITTDQSCPPPNTQ